MVRNKRNSLPKVVETSELIQVIPAECAVASLGIILAYYNRPVALEELAIACGVSETSNGVGNLMRVARQYGLKAQAVRLLPASLLAGQEKLEATRVVIAHRLSTIITADRIFVIDNGQITQSGPYQELITQPGLFAELAKRQIA